MGFIVLLLFSALAVSAVAGYFSIVGLMSIFPAAAMSILAMGVVLEIAKLVTASWVYRYWDKAALVLKTYFSIAVVVLSLITSLGIFGFLSRAHLEHTISVGGDNELRVSQLERQIANERRTITDGETVLAQLDQTVQTLIDYDRIRGDEGALAVRKNQAEERTTLNNQIQSSIQSIEKIQQELLPLQKQKLDIELEVGPIKYVAEAIYGETGQDVIDKAVRLIIILLIFVFDPLAILLVIAANMSLRERNGELITFTTFDDTVTETAEDIIPENTEEELAEQLEAVDRVMEKDREILAKLANGDSLNPADRQRIKNLDWLIDKKRK
jgi:hypothetical protein